MHLLVLLTMHSLLQQGWLNHISSFRRKYFRRLESNYTFILFDGCVPPPAITVFHPILTRWNFLCFTIEVKFFSKIFFFCGKQEISTGNKEMLLVSSAVAFVLNAFQRLCFYHSSSEATKQVSPIVKCTIQHTHFKVWAYFFNVTRRQSSQTLLWQ